MLNLALWLKKNGFRADQVQAFYPSPMASATTMYYSEKNPLHQVTYKSEKVATAKTPEQRKLHKAFLRWHDPKNWPLLRKAMAEMGRQELIGDGDNQLIPHYKAGEEQLVYEAHRRKNKGGEHQKRVGKPVRLQRRVSRIMVNLCKVQRLVNPILANPRKRQRANRMRVSRRVGRC